MTIVQIVVNIDGSMWVWDPVNQTFIEINPALYDGFYKEDTVDDLRLVDDNGALRYAVTFGQLAAGDGQARAYRWNPSSAAADDGISVVRPASQAAGALGAWEEL